MNTNMKFSITGQRIELTEPVMLVAGTVHIYTAAFVFDSAWDGYIKTAVFRSGGVEREQLLTDDACTVPWEVLNAGKYLRVGVYGTKDDIRLPTIWTERTQYINSGAGPTEEASKPSPTLVEQLLTKVGNLDSLKTEDKSSLVAAINEVWATGGGGSGASVTDASINEDGHLIIKLSTGKVIDAGYAVGPAGADGKDGAPGQAGPPGPAGADGVGIQSIAQTTTSTEDGGTNVITVTKSDGTSSTFAVRNGSRGSVGPAGADGKDGQDGAPGKDGADGAAGPAGADGKSAYQYAQDGGYTGTEEEFEAKLAAEIPTTLPNPNALTFTGAVTGTYDGSKPLNVEIPSGGGGSLSAFEKIGTIDLSTMAAPNLGVEYTVTDVTEVVLVWTGMTNTTTSNSILLLSFNDSYYFNTIAPRTGKAGLALNGYSYLKVLEGVGLLSIVGKGAVSNTNYAADGAELPYNLIPVKEKIQTLKIGQPSTQYYADAGIVEVYVR